MKRGFNTAFLVGDEVAIQSVNEGGDYAYIRGIVTYVSPQRTRYTVQIPTANILRQLPKTVRFAGSGAEYGTRHGFVCANWWGDSYRTLNSMERSA